MWCCGLCVLLISKAMPAVAYLPAGQPNWTNRRGNTGLRTLWPFRLGAGLTTQSCKNSLEKSKEEINQNLKKKLTELRETTWKIDFGFETWQLECLILIQKQITSDVIATTRSMQK
ncbi:hypothetical protein CDAR_577361 [Caerostris darwini]|uniref:Uncharacterized protein n=1 Tax=Caerostris darwini TaxID=1538125 RepID=A0AAV4N7J0_9ARAC|nr:hypothetical protein CDAR_577361 [Caerostris darwini]